MSPLRVGSGMTMFGINIPIENIRKKTYIDEHVDTVLKRNDERKVFKQFLESKTSSGQIVFDEINKTARLKANELLQNDINIPSDALFGFTISSLKNIKSGKLNVYDSIVRKIIEEQCPKYKTLHQNIDSGKFKGSTPFGYPDASKRAQGILNAKIKDSLSEIRTDYLKDKMIKEKINEYSREMFHSINKLGLSDFEVVRYLKVIFELSTVEEYPRTKSADLKQIVAIAIKRNEEINLIHIKCLRFVYPRSGGVEILTHTDDVVVDGIRGKYVPKSEKKLFTRLKKVSDIFTNNGLRINFKVIVADDDLDLLFPSGNKYVDKLSLDNAKKQAKTYVDLISKKHDANFSFENMSDLISRLGTGYFQFREQVLRDIKAGKGNFVNPNFFEKDRVDHQYEYYQMLFGNDYSREEARRSIGEQTASTIALEKVIECFGKNTILIEENRGGDNNLIANRKFPVVFTRLRDEAKFDVE